MELVAGCPRPPLCRQPTGERTIHLASCTLPLSPPVFLNTGPAFVALLSAHDGGACPVRLVSVMA
jgi:hypothetical protein